MTSAIQYEIAKKLLGVWAFELGVGVYVFANF
jgi:hypothetical protein